MSEWRKGTTKDFDGGHRMTAFNKMYPEMQTKLGEPFINGITKDYPDDPHKTDVCWVFLNLDNSGKVLIWNYKNGPAYYKKVLIWNYKNGTVYYKEEIPTIDQIEGFSVWYSSKEDFDDFCKTFNL